MCVHTRLCIFLGSFAFSDAFLRTSVLIFVDISIENNNIITTKCRSLSLFVFLFVFLDYYMNFIVFI